MIDRFGRKIQVGWSDHEELWVEAALTLKGDDRIAALWDIAELTGRGIHNVRAKAQAIASQRRLELATRAMVTRAIMVPAHDAYPAQRRKRAA